MLAQAFTQNLYEISFKLKFCYLLCKWVKSNLKKVRTLPKSIRYLIGMILMVSGRFQLCLSSSFTTGKISFRLGTSASQSSLSSLAISYPVYYSKSILRMSSPSKNFMKEEYAGYSLLCKFFSSRHLSLFWLSTDSSLKKAWKSSIFMRQPLSHRLWWVITYYLCFGRKGKKYFYLTFGLWASKNNSILFGQ